MLYSQTQRPKEAEDAHQEALTIRRQLAKTNPLVYQPNVAVTLHNLAVLALTQGHISPAQEWIAEAITINRHLWQNNPTAYGDSLAWSLIIQTRIWEHVAPGTTTICELVKEVGSVAYQAELKHWAQEQTVAVCGKTERQ